MKIYDGMYKFVCDKCFDVAGISSIEQDALETTREVARRYGWEWRHPHWGLICNKCLQYEKEHMSNKGD
jgi:hypothetical protein